MAASIFFSKSISRYICVAIYQRYIFLNHGIKSKLDNHSKRCKEIKTFLEKEMEDYISYQQNMQETEKWTAIICPKANLTADAKCDGLADGNFTLNINTLVNEITCTFIFVSVIFGSTQSRI